MIPVLAGLLAGATHVLAGPDHLAAIAPLAVHRRTQAWAAGMRWGFGHASGVVFVGLIALALREMLPIESISSWSERVVGVVLVGIGLWGFRTATRTRVHTHEHSHDGTTHEHLHIHAEPHVDAPRPAHRHIHAAFAVGTLHGIAGSAHFLGILPALALPSMLASVGYVAGFAAGSVAAMTLFAAGLGTLSGDGARETSRYHRRLLVGFSSVAVVVGGIWLLGDL